MEKSSDIKMSTDNTNEILKKQIEEAGISLDRHLSEWEKDTESNIYIYNTDDFRIIIYRWESMTKSSSDSDTTLEIGSSGKTPLACLMHGMLPIKPTNKHYFRIDSDFKEGKFVKGDLFDIDLENPDPDIKKGRKITPLKNISELEQAIQRYFFKGDSSGEFRAILYKSELPEEYRKSVGELIN